jgi:hypothetical protein
LDGKIEIKREFIMRVLMIDDEPVFYKMASGPQGSRGYELE